MKNLIEALNRRYATKKFDINKKLNQDDLDILFEAMRLTPSSFGLQPWKFIHVKNPETRMQLQESSRGQSKVTEASDLIVIAAKTKIQESDVEEYIQDMIGTRKVDVEKISEDPQNMEELLGFKKRMLDTIGARTAEQLKGWSQKQCYIVAGVLLTACAQMGIDACPMEGFEVEKYDEILGLNELGLTATVVIPVGYRSSEDSFADLIKVRYAKEKLIIQK